MVAKTLLAKGGGNAKRSRGLKNANQQNMGQNRGIRGIRKSAPMSR